MRAPSRLPHLACLALAAALAGCPGAPEGPRPTVFVHGLGGEAADSFPLMIDWLRGHGWDGVPLVAFKMSDSDRCIAASAKELEAAVEALVRETGSPTVDLVGHSLGGLVVRHYVKNLRGKDRARNVVLLTTPNHGTTLAPWYGPECSVAEMSWNSLYLRGLNSPDETPVARVRYTNVRSLADRFVQPGESALLEGAADRAVWLDHFQVLARPESFRLVKDGLSGLGENDAP